jgi:hypothetical protein
MSSSARALSTAGQARGTYQTLVHAQVAAGDAAAAPPARTRDQRAALPTLKKASPFCSAVAGEPFGGGGGDGDGDGGGGGGCCCCTVFVAPDARVCVAAAAAAREDRPRPGRTNTTLKTTDRRAPTNGNRQISRTLQRQNGPGPQ